MTRLISLAVLIAIIIVIGLLFYKVFIGFFVPVFLASVLVVVFRPLHDWVLVKTGHRDNVAAAVTTLLIMLALFLPLTVVVVSAAVQGLKLVEQNDATTVLFRINKVRDALGLDLPSYDKKIKIIESEINDIIGETERLRTTGALSGEAEIPGLRRLGTQTIASLEELKAEVQPTLGPRWDANFEELFLMTEQLGLPSETEFGASDLAVSLKSKFATLKTGLLGGGLMAFAREKTNPTQQEVEELTLGALDYVRPRLLSITGATGAFLIRLIFGGVILTVATFFFLYDGPSMIKTIMHLSPLDDAYKQELLLEFGRISRAVVLATLLSAIAQGLTAGLGYFVVGMDYLVLLVMLTTVFAMVPFVGPAVIWIPVCLYVGLYEERYLAASLLATWGVLVVGTIDNVVKALVLHGQSQLHPLLALLSVLGGVQTLGPIGIVVGPMVVAMLQTLLSILQRELVQFEKQELSSKKSEPRARFKSRTKSQPTSRTEAKPPIESSSDNPSTST